MKTPQSAQPLAGLRVIEVGHSIAGPFAGQVLADLGADVTKVERPGVGDDARAWGPPFWHGSSVTFQSVNRKKTSVAIDLKDPAGIAQLLGLAASADVLIHNMRPGLMAKLGLGAERLRDVNPKLIYCSISAFGSAGPLAEHPGYDPLMQAFAGIMSVTGEEDRPPVRVGPSIVDLGAGMWTAIGVLAALRERDRTGEGCVVDTSLFETALAWMTIPIATTFASGRPVRRTGSETPMLAPYRAFAASDKDVVIAAGNDNLFRRLCGALNMPGLAEEARFSTNALRVENRAELNASIEEVVAREPAAVWIDRLSAAGVPCAPIQSVQEVLDHPQTLATGMIGDTSDGRMSLVGSPLRFDGERPPIGASAPALSEPATPGS